MVPLSFRLITLTFLCAASAFCDERKTLHGHLPTRTIVATPVGRLPGTDKLHLTLGLPLRNPEALTNLLARLYDPSSPDFRHFQSPAEFTENFGPTESDYQKLGAFAQANGLAVANTHANRTLMEVEGTVADIEKTFGVTLRTYQHPTESRNYYAPDVEPTTTLDIPVAHISGLDNFRRPQPMSLHPAAGNRAIPLIGSGPQGYYFGSDFRAAYVPGTTLTGTGQSVALVELDGYYAVDVSSYLTKAKLPNVPLKNVLIGGFNGSPDPTGTGNEEVSLDIDMAISMAPGLSQVLVYEASPTSGNSQINALLNRIATDNTAKQIGCSWGFDIDSTTQQIFQEYAAQGQSFFLASGDSGSSTGGVLQPEDNPNITVVGGTVLTSSASHAWLSETTWSGSGGGISTIYPLPSWQRGLGTPSNRGSTTFRNVPDVAMVADGVWLIADRGSSFPINGTSIAAPLWAGLTALINQQGAAAGAPPVGFLNPALYAIAQGANYRTDFHDITTGNNENTANPTLYRATAGYDLCTGWGTPAGSGLINDLLALNPADALVITPPLGFTAFGSYSGPYNVSSQAYTLTNAGTVPISWTISKLPPWLKASTSGGTLVPGGTSTVVNISLDAASSQMLIGSSTADVVFSDTSTGKTQSRTFSLAIGNGGFETGDFSSWTFSGDTNANYADSYDAAKFTSGTPAVDDSKFVHSGIYGANLGAVGSLASLTQRLPVSAGQVLLLSFWLDNPATGTPNRFRALWDGRVLYDKSSLGIFGWTNLQFVVTATGSSASVVFQFQNDNASFGLDDISVKPVSVPVIQNVSQNSGQTSFQWNSAAGVKYQPQSATDLNGPTWTNLGNPIIAVGATSTITDTDNTGQVKFYRVLIGAQ